MKNLCFVLLAALTLVSCGPKKSWETKSIQTKEKTLMDMAKNGRVDTATLTELLHTYQRYATMYPDDTISAEYLFKAADFYRYLHKPAKSIELYQNIYTNYPGSAKRPYALFLQGFIYENEMGKIDSAKAKYQQFLVVYPNHPIAKDVKITLANLGKTPEQLIDEFEERQHADSLQKTKSK